MRTSDRDRAQAQAEAQAAWVEQLQQRVARLEMENRELRRQLDELRRGVGIAVLIQGRPIALSALTPTIPSHVTDTPSLSFTGPHPAVNPHLGPAPKSVPSPMPLTGGPRSRVNNAGPRSYALETAPRSVPAPEDLWLTGRQRAVRPPYAPPLGDPYQAPQVHGQTPSQHVTPDWLRDPAPSLPLPGPAPEMAARSTTGSHRAISPAESQQPRRSRAGSAARPLRTRLEPADVPSLAQLTGQHPAMRPQNKRPEGERNPFEDSFVLD